VDRLKLRPTSRFIKNTVSAAGQAILLLGVRKAESAARAQRILRYSEKSQGARLSPHNDVSGCSIFRPMEELGTDDVWRYLRDTPAPWGESHEPLIALYEKANGPDWPFVLNENGAPSATSVLARFGCWTCTVVDRDRSLASLNGAGHAELAPLLRFRDRLKEVSNSPDHRSMVRRNGRRGLGPLTFSARQMLLGELCAVQNEVDFQLISRNELIFIKEQWTVDQLSALPPVPCTGDDHARTGHCGLGWTCAECVCRH
jgi:DNA sulfur modification protein DndC